MAQGKRNPQLSSVADFLAYIFVGLNVNFNFFNMIIILLDFNNLAKIIILQKHDVLPSGL